VIGSSLPGNETQLRFAVSDDEHVLIQRRQ